MFYVSSLELSVTCLLALALLIVPFWLRRYYFNVERRLRNLEKKVERKNSDTLVK